MKLNYFITAFVVVALTATSCKKNETPGPDDIGGAGTLTMKAGGTLREANTAFVLTVHDDEDEQYVIGLTALFTPVGSDNDEVTDAFHIYMGFTEAQFNNPKGTYDVVALNSDPEGRPLVYGLYQVGVGTNDGRTYGIVDANKTVGKLTITDFTIGNQSGIPGLSGRGYTKLQGTFHMTLTEVRTDGSGIGGELAITEGKFNVRNQLGF